MIHGVRHRTPSVLPGGALLNSWIEAGGAPERPIIIRSLRHRWCGFWFERFADLSAKQCSAVDLPLDPVFIVGLWRTGSTVLHTKLTGATSWTTPRTWQCFRPADFLHRSPLMRRQALRPMDSGVIDTFSAQEDEFAALLLGEESTYRAFIDPRRLDQLSHLLETWRQQPSDSAPPLSSRWENFLRAVLLDRPGRLLLKSPNHTFRLPWMAKRFPRAKFIWVLRPIKDVMSSNERMWSLMAERYGQWRLVSSELKAFLRKAVDNHDELLEWARDEIPDRVLLTHFEEVMRDDGLVPRLLTRLGETK